MGIDGRTMQDGNFPRKEDSTAELIRKHKIYRPEWERILSGEISRSKDYWGGYDDSVANDLSEIEEYLCERAVFRHDREAMLYLNEAKVDVIHVAPGWIRTANDALEALEKGDIEGAKQLLAKLKVDEYPDTGDAHEE